MAINDLERRVLANLAIPRNVADLYGHLCNDVYSPVGPGTPERALKSGIGLEDESALDKFLREHLEPAGYVLKINPIEDVAKLAAKPPKHTYDWHEESRENYANRLVVPSRRWRAAGDLWLLADAGLEEIKEPVGSAPDMTLGELQATIDQMYARIGKDLLDEEYAIWLKDVLDYHNVGPKDLTLPQGGGASGWSDVFENRILDQENQKTVMPALVDPWFMALSILAFNDTDTGTTADNGSHIPTYTGYARKSVAASLMSAAASGSSNNSGGAITFAACTAGSSTILAFANCSTTTVGELRKWGDCASTVISTTQTPATFNTAAYVTTAD